MKKVVKKLKLSKETLRTLGGETLGKVVAGNADRTNYCTGGSEGCTADCAASYTGCITVTLYC